MKQRVLRILPVLFLLTITLINFGRVMTQKASPDQTGGFAMHSTFRSMLFRFVRVYGIDEAGDPHRIRWQGTYADTPMLGRPTASNAKEVVTRIREGRNKTAGQFQEYVVEVWRYTYPAGEPRLGARFVASQRVRIQQ